MINTQKKQIILRVRDLRLKILDIIGSNPIICYHDKIHKKMVFFLTSILRRQQEKKDYKIKHGFKVSILKKSRTLLAN